MKGTWVAGFLFRRLTESQMALFNMLSSAIVGLASLLAVPIFSRLLTQSDYGLTGVYTAWVQIFSVIVGLQVGGSIGSAYANLEESEQDSYQLSILVLALLSFGITMLIVGFTLVPLSELLEMPSVMVICALVQSFGTSVVGVFNKRYIFRKQAQSNLVLSVSVSVSSSILAIVLVVLRPWGLEPYLAWALGYVLPPVFAGLLLIVWLMVRTKAAIRVRYWWFCLRITLPIILHGLSGVALAQMGRLGIQHEYGDAMAGVYGIAITVESILMALYSALNSSFVPFMYDDLAGKTDASTKMSHFCNYFILFSIATCIFVLLGPEVVKILAPPDYWEATDIVPLLVVGVYFVFLYSFPVNYEFYKMKTLSIGIGTLSAAVINAILVIWLVPTHGMLGAAIATTVSYGFLFLFHYLIARYLLGDRNYPFRSFFLGIIGIFLAATFAIIAKDFMLIRLIIAAVLLLALGLRLLKTRSIF